MKILIVEDERPILKALHKGLTKQGYVVDQAEDGEQALDLYYENTYDVILLDLNLPKIDGIDVLREIRKEDKFVHVLILSARDEVEDKVKGLDLGANDYLGKPFHFAELDARIRALLRRDYHTKDAIIQCGDVKIDMALKKTFVADTLISLSGKEYAILEHLMMHKGRIISGWELLQHIWESDTDMFSNAFKVHIHNLRKQLPDGFIKNRRGEGYYVE